LNVGKLGIGRDPKLRLGRLKLKFRFGKLKMLPVPGPPVPDIPFPEPVPELVDPGPLVGPLSPD
jgi:hypothetical protein